MQRSKLDEQTAIIRDGATDFGQSCAAYLASRGNNVVVNVPPESPEVGSTP